MQLTATDREQILTAREANALLPIENHRVEASVGTIFVGCSDGDQFKDVYEHHCKVCANLRHHPLLLNGGALLLSPHSPIRGAKKDGTVLLRHVNAASRIKGIHSIVLYVHAPCGVARAAKLDFFEVMRNLLEGKRRLRAQRGCSRLKVTCFCHVDYPSATSEVRKRTYFVNRAKMTEFLTAHGREIRA